MSPHCCLHLKRGAGMRLGSPKFEHGCFVALSRCPWLRHCRAWLMGHHWHPQLWISHADRQSQGINMQYFGRILRNIMCLVIWEQARRRKRKHSSTRSQRVLLLLATMVLIGLTKLGQKLRQNISKLGWSEWFVPQRLCC